MKNELTDPACILAELNQTPATGPVAMAWEDSDGKTVMCNIPRHLARQLLASKDAGALLTESLKSANGLAEQFERKSYLLGDQIEAKDAEIAALRKDAERLDWLDQNIFPRENLDFKGRLHPTMNMWVMFSPKGHQGSARNILDAAIAQAVQPTDHMEDVLAMVRPVIAHAVQPILKDAKGVLRFKENSLVVALWKHGGKTGLDLNDLHRMDFTDEDRQQFAQLIGYSIEGYGTLIYVTDAAYEAAQQAIAQAVQPTSP